MTKKIISLMLIFAILVPISSAVAADNPTAQPTIEEILNGYHEKAFAARVAEENGSVSTYSSRSGSGKTLEQETVDELTAAGYEAYNVTAENYDTLEETLQIDFAELGLSKEETYVIVIDGEVNTQTSNNGNARSLPEQEIIDDGGGAFLYQYNDIYYSMKYVTVAGGETSNSGKVTMIAQTDPSFMEKLAHYVDLAVEEVVSTISSILDWLGIEIPDENSKITGVLYCEAEASWSYKYIVIYDEQFECWRPAGRTEYAVVSATLSGETHDAFTDETTEYNKTKSYYCYASLYHDMETFKLFSAMNFAGGLTYFDKTGHIDILLRGSDGSTTSILTLWELN